jgi:hypothetical protein
MEDNMKSPIKKYWWAILIVLALPVIANWIVLCPSIVPIAGESKDWLNFLAVYFSGIIAALVSFSILYKTIETNNIENSKNRNLQVRTIRYQSKLNWINELKKAVTHISKVYDEEIINDFYQLFLLNKPHIELENLYIKAFHAADEATFQLETVIMGCNDKDIEKFYSDFREHDFRYKNYIEDILWLLKFPDGFVNSKGMSNKEFFQKELSIMRKNSPHKENNEDVERIWVIAQKYDFEILSKRAEILHDLRFYYDTYLFNKECIHVINLMISNAEKILEDGNE